MSDDQTTPTPTHKPLPPISPIGQWLCKNAWARAGEVMKLECNKAVPTWDELDSDAQNAIWLFAQSVLCYTVGIGVTESILAGKAEILATAKAHKDRDQREGGEE